MQVVRKLHKNEMDLFAKLTRSYLRAREIALVTLVPQGQHWRNYQHILNEENKVSNNTGSLSATVLVHDRGVALEARSSPSSSNVLSLLEPESPIWTVWMTIQAYNAKDIPPLIEEDGKTYLNILSVGLDHVFVARGDEQQPSSNKQNDRLEWMLSALTLSLALLLAVLIVRCSYTARRHHAHQRRHTRQRQGRDGSLLTGTGIGAAIRIPYPLWLHRQWRHQPMNENGDNSHHQKNIMSFHRDEKDDPYDLEEEEVLSSIVPEDCFIESTSVATPRSNHPQLPPSLAPTGSSNGMGSTGGDCIDVGAVAVTSAGQVSIESNIIMAESSNSNSAAGGENRNQAMNGDNGSLALADGSHALIEDKDKDNYNDDNRKEVSVSTTDTSSSNEDDKNATMSQPQRDTEEEKGLDHVLENTMCDAIDDETSTTAIVTTDETDVQGSLVYI